MPTRQNAGAPNLPSSDAPDEASTSRTCRARSPARRVRLEKILSGTPPEKAASRDSLANPEVLDRYVEFAGRLGV